MIADDLSRIAMSSGLGETLGRAMELARGRGHGEVTLEHMLLALCEDPDAGLVLAASNVDLAQLKADANLYVERLETRSAPGQGEPAVSSDLRRILEAAAAAARGGRRREINGAIVLAAVVGDGRSPAAQLLQAQGLTFEGAIRALQGGAGTAPRPSAPANTEDILASARERVQSRFGPPRTRKPVVDETPPEPEAAPPAASSDEKPKAQQAEPPALAKEKRAPAKKRAPPAPAPAPPDLAGADDFVPGEETGASVEPVQNEEDAPVLQEAAPPPPPPPPAFPLTPDESQSARPPHVPPPIPGADPSSAPSLGPPPPPAPDDSRFPPAARHDRVGMPPSPPPPPPPGPSAAPPPPIAPPPIPQAPTSDAASVRLPAERARRPVPPGAPPMGSRFGRQVAAHRVEIGQLVENVPRIMRVAVPDRVEVRIARAEVQALAEGLQGGGAAYKHEVTITKAMSVRLKAPDGGFYIETASPETQWIEKSMLSADDYASWRWHVTPRTKGRKRLQLIISARTIGADGLAAETALPDQVITVRVRTNYAKSMVRWTGWAAAAIVGGLLAKFGEGALDAGMQAVAKFAAG
jgi:neural Wiskott-Aldrich syndrome protein